MIVVLDTNVVVSALLKPGGVCGQILAALAKGRFAACVCNDILLEYAGVLNRPHLKIESADAAYVMELFLEVALNVAGGAELAGLPDPDDEVFLATASAGAVDYLVSGNLRHFPAQLCRGVRVISPAEFLKLLRAG